jgi:hypothetical protein
MISYKIFNNGVRNVKIELIENFLCDGVNNLRYN